MNAHHFAALSVWFSEEAKYITIFCFVLVLLIYCVLYWKGHRFVNCRYIVYTFHMLYDTRVIFLPISSLLDLCIARNDRKLRACSHALKGFVSYVWPWATRTSNLSCGLFSLLYSQCIAIDLYAIIMHILQHQYNLILPSRLDWIRKIKKPDRLLLWSPIF